MKKKNGKEERLNGGGGVRSRGEGRGAMQDEDDIERRDYWVTRLPRSAAAVPGPGRDVRLLQMRAMFGVCFDSVPGIGDSLLCFGSTWLDPRNANSGGFIGRETNKTEYCLLRINHFTKTREIRRNIKGGNIIPNKSTLRPGCIG